MGHLNSQYFWDTADVKRIYSRVSKITGSQLVLVSSTIYFDLF